MNYVSVFNHGRIEGVIQEGDGMLHPVLVVSIWEVVSGVGTTRLLASLGRVDRHLGLNHKILKLHGFDQICVPDLAAVRDPNILHVL